MPNNTNKIIDIMEQWEEKLTYRLQLAMEIETFEDPYCQPPLLQLVDGVPAQIMQDVSVIVTINTVTSLRDYIFNSQEGI